MTYEDTISPNSGTLVRDRLWFDDGFAMIPNSWIRDKHLARTARMIAVELASHEPGFELSISYLVSTGTEGREAVTTALSQLERAGYLKRYRGRDRGRFGRIRWHLRDPHKPDGLHGALELDLEGMQPLRTRKSRSAPITGFPFTVEPSTVEPSTVDPHTIEDHLKEYLTQELKTGDSTRAGIEEDAAQVLARSLHAPCPFFARRHRECVWAVSGYCENCGRARPSLIPVEGLS